jgi:hypothetical protein
VLAGYDVLEGVNSLGEKSLLQEGAAGGEGSEPRFVLLETLHEYAREALAARAETEVLRARHAAYVLALAEEAEPALAGPRQGAWLARLETEHDNLRAVLRWAREDEGHREVGLRLAAAVWRFWNVRGHLSEGRGWLEEVSAPAGAGAHTSFGTAAVRAKALNGAGVLAYEQGDYARATVLHEESLALRHELGHKQGIAANLDWLARAAAGPAMTPEHRHRAARLLGAADALRAAIGAPLPPSERADYERTVAALRASLGDVGYEVAWAGGQALTLDEAFALALATSPVA